jgi:hypothetical protein
MCYGPTRISVGCSTRAARDHPALQGQARGRPGGEEDRGDQAAARRAESRPTLRRHQETAYGTKFVLVAASSDEIPGRMILDMKWMPDKGGEAKVAMGCFNCLHPLVPSAQGVASP